jgi:hypothetical protein
MIELEKGQLSYVATKVIYNGREYNAPISYSTLIYYDLMFEFLLERKEERRKKK